MASAYDVIYRSVQQAVTRTYEGRKGIDIEEMQGEFQMGALTNPALAKALDQLKLQWHDIDRAVLTTYQREQLTDAFSKYADEFRSTYKADQSQAMTAGSGSAMAIAAESALTVEESLAANTFMQPISAAITTNSFGVADSVWATMDDQEKTMRGLVYHTVNRTEKYRKLWLTDAQMDALRTELVNLQRTVQIGEATGQVDATAMMGHQSQEQQREINQLAGAEGGGMQPYQASLAGKEDTASVYAILDSMPENERQEMIANLAGYPGLIANWKRPEYSAERGYGGPTYSTFTRRDKREQLRGPGGFARTTDDENLIKDVKTALVEILTHHYRVLGIGKNTMGDPSSGTLLQALQQGEVVMDRSGRNSLTFKYTMADIERPARTSEGGKGGAPRGPGRRQASLSTAPVMWPLRPGTHMYGPWVFQGRPPIVSVGKMSFKNTTTGKWINTNKVSEAPPRDVFEMSGEDVKFLIYTIANKLAHEVLTDLLGVGEAAA